MKRLFSIVAIAALATSMAACGDRGTAQTCDPDTLDGTVVCYDATTGAFAIENDAVLRFGTDNDVFGNAIVDLWNRTYPEHAGKVEFVNTGAQGTTDAVAEQQGEYPDVFMAIDGEVSRNAAHLLNIDANLANIIRSNSVNTFFNAGNSVAGAVHYAPMTYDGMAFVVNYTMLETLGYSTADSNGDGLPDAFDTWEEIFELSQTWATDRPTYKGKTINVVYPLTLTNQWSDYHHLSSAGWELFGTGDATKPGYDDPKFAQSLEFLLAARDAKISVEESGVITPGTAMGWRWDSVINDEISPFGMIGTWMDVEAAASANNINLKVTPLPTWRGVNQRPFVKTKGFVINAYTNYRSAATELLRLIYSKDGFAAMVNGTSYAPSLVDGSALVPTLPTGGIQEQIMGAFIYNYPEPALTMPNNPAKKAMDSAFYGVISDFEVSIWDGELTIAEAVAELIELANERIAQDNQ